MPCEGEPTPIRAAVALRVAGQDVYTPGTDDRGLLELDLQPLPLVHAAPANLQQIFVNLVNNAIDACAGRPDARQAALKSRQKKIM